jgi:putative PIN family toxin of toxin-antitoxin system
MNKFFVIDTTNLLNASLFKNTKPRFAVNIAINEGKLAVSKETIAEFMDVINRNKFDKYFLYDEERLELFNELEDFFEFFSPKETITDCADSKDNKFLELAIECQASCIISGDCHLLDLHPFRNIPILNTADFLSQY